MVCDHSAPHSGRSRYIRDTAQLRLMLVCDGCGTERREVARIDYRPHPRRLSAQLAELIARELGFDDHQVDRVRFATLISDVGRDEIPAEILNKRGTLTAEDWVEVRRQPELAAALLSDTTFDDVREWILTRRERPDGQGYPHGLTGDQIPAEAKILSVVDAYVAMTTDRPHRSARPQSWALRELLDHAGRQFDATVVEAFARAILAPPAGDRVKISAASAASRRPRWRSRVSRGGG